MIPRFAVILLLASGCEAPSVADGRKDPNPLEVEACVLPSLEAQTVVLLEQVGHVVVNTSGGRWEARTEASLREMLFTHRQMAPNNRELFVLVDDPVPDLARYKTLARLALDVGFTEQHQCSSLRGEANADILGHELLRDRPPYPSEPTNDLAGIPEPRERRPGGPRGRVQLEDVTLLTRMNVQPEREALLLRQAQFRSCYEQALEAHPGLQGVVRVTVVVAAEGNVLRADITEPSLDGQAAQCIRGVLGRTTFPPNSGGNITIVRLFFRLIPFRVSPAVRRLRLANGAP